MGEGWRGVTAAAFVTRRRPVVLRVPHTVAPKTTNDVRYRPNIAKLHG